MLLNLSSIVIDERLRTNLGNIEELAESIKAHGLIHPPVITLADDGSAYHLVAGGRRCAALALIDKETGKDSVIDFTVLEDLSEAKRKLIEIEENVRRKDMTWQEKVQGLATYHKLSRREAKAEGDSWTQAQTGALLNLSQASVSIALSVAEDLNRNPDKYKDCDSLQGALQLKTRENLDLAQKELLNRIQRRNEVAKQAIISATPAAIASTGTEKEAAAIVHVEVKDALKKEKGISKDDIAAFYYHGNCLDILPTLAKAHTINHIVCDPPYGIDMDFLSGGDSNRQALVGRTAAEHTVAGNLELIPEFLRVAFDVIALDGFLCMWYDLDHHEKIAEWATKIGWKVCRWPLVWCKPHAMNQSAQYNITKATEVCYIMRRSEQSIIKVKQSKNWIMAPSASSPSHPFCKPYEVWKYLLETVSLEGQTVLDPFAGEGSSLAASFKLGRIPVGIECKEEHIASGLSYIQEQLNDPLAALLSGEDSPL